MDKVTGATPKEDESERLAAQLDMTMEALGGTFDRDTLGGLYDTRIIDHSRDRLLVINEFMRYKGANSHHKKNARKK